MALTPLAVPVDVKDKADAQPLAINGGQISFKMCELAYRTKW